MAFFNLDDYETVETRLEKFWAKYPNGRTETKLLKFDGGQYIVWSAIYRDIADSVPFATGIAEETVQGRGVNSTSACENAETSSLGRSLANGGFAAKGKRASAEEMSKVASQTKAQEAIADVKAKMSQTASTYVPVPKEDDPWTIKSAAPVQTMEGAVDLLKQELGAVTERDIPKCKCGKDMGWRTGINGKTKREWGHFTCTNVPARQCQDPIWYEIGANGTWKPQERKY